MPTATVSDVEKTNDGIQEVWQTNLEEEFKQIRKVVQTHPYVAMVCMNSKFSSTTIK